MTARNAGEGEAMHLLNLLSLPKYPVSEGDALSSRRSLSLRSGIMERFGASIIDIM
jgi:hypothetical protein